MRLCPGELHNDSNMLLDAVPEEEDEASSTAEDKAGPRPMQVAQQPGGVCSDCSHGGTTLAVGAVLSLRLCERMRCVAGPGDGSGGAAVKAAGENGTDTLREFKVKGRLQEAEDKLNLRLRILQHDSELSLHADGPGCASSWPLLAAASGAGRVCHGLHLR